jgi:hypothetical protein
MGQAQTGARTHERASLSDLTKTWTKRNGSRADRVCVWVASLAERTFTYFFIRVDVFGYVVVVWVGPLEMS